MIRSEIQALISYAYDYLASILGEDAVSKYNRAKSVSLNVRKGANIYRLIRALGRFENLTEKQIKAIVSLLMGMCELETMPVSALYELPSSIKYVPIWTSPPSYLGADPDEILRKPATSTAKNPSASEDGYVIYWNNLAQKWDIKAASVDTWRPIHDIPVDAATDTSISSNWAYDHLNAVNPHNITKSTIGLDLVENTALSTWSGSTNITTLGTIVTGTWNASNIAATYITQDSTHRFVTDTQIANWNTAYSTYIKNVAHSGVGQSLIEGVASQIATLKGVTSADSSISISSGIGYFDLAVDESNIDHDLLLNFVANEHIDHSSVSINGTNSITGGGDLTASRTLQLVNDSASPGNLYFYGTSAVGTKGWYALSSVAFEPIITPGNTNQYWRGDKTWQTLTTSVVPEGTNAYWTQSRFDTAFLAKDTDDLSEGITNLYFTDERAQDAVGTILVDSASIDFTYDDVANTITAVVVSGSHTHTLVDVTDVTATAAEVNLLDLSGLTIGWVLSADSATTASWQQILFSDIGSTPTTLSGYGISDTKANFDLSLSDGNFMYVGDPPTAHTHTLADVTDVTATAAEVNLLDLSTLTVGWVLRATGASTAAWGQLLFSNLGSTPTTLSGYGISDTKANFDAALSDGDFMYIGDPPTAHTHVKADITDFAHTHLLADVTDVTATSAEVNASSDLSAIVTPSIGWVYRITSTGPTAAAWSQPLFSDLGSTPTTLAGYGISDTKANFNTALSDGTFLFTGDVTQYTDEMAQDAVGNFWIDTQTINFTYTDATPEFKADVVSQMSITADASGIKLSGDVASPGNTYYYGTNGTGTKGWYVLSVSSDAFKTWHYNADSGYTWGTADIVASGVDTMDIVPGSGIAIDTDSTLKAIRIRTTGSGGLTSAYVSITDGTTTANASGGDTFKLLTGNDRLTITVTETPDDRATFTINEANLSIAWGQITSTPTTLSGYGISDTKANFNTALSDGDFMFVGDAPTAHTHVLANITDVNATATEVNDATDLSAITTPSVGWTYRVTSTGPTTAAWGQPLFSDLGSTPTTLSGYGISDTKANFDTALSDGNFMYIGDPPTAHTHLLAAGATDVTATAAEVNLLDLSGLSAGWVLRATGASTAAWSQLAYSDLSGTPSIPTQLSDLSDVVSATNTNRFVLVANGTTGYVGRLLVEADISDLGSYLTSYDSFKTWTIQSDAGYTWASSNVVASGVDTIDLVAGSGISINSDATLKAFRITSSITQYTDEQAQDSVGNFWIDTSTVNFTYTDATPEFKADVVYQMSITADASGLKLSGDSASPGNSYYYGTNGVGTKGWYTLPAADTHALLSATHTDTTPGTVVRGDIITGQGVTPTWTRLAKGTENYVLKSSATDVVWGQIAFSEITSTPTTLSGYGISDTKANFNTALSDGSFMFVGDAPTAHTHTLDEVTDVTSTVTEVNTATDLSAITTPSVGWVYRITGTGPTAAAWGQPLFSDIGSTPTTLSGYGISDTKANFNSALSDGDFMYIGDPPTAHTHTLSAGATDVTASAAEVNLLDLSGLSVGWVLRATGATTAAWSQLAYSDLSGTPSIPSQLSDLSDVVSATNTNRYVLVANGTTGYVGRLLVEADISDLGSYITTYDSFKTWTIQSDVGYTWGSSNVVASGIDTVDFVAGSNITIESDAALKAIRITSSGGGGAGSGTVGTIPKWTTTTTLTDSLITESSGKIGINEGTPLAQLHITDDTPGQLTSIRLDNTDATSGSGLSLDYYDGSNIRGYWRYTAAAAQFDVGVVHDNGTFRFVMGSTTPTTAFSIGPYNVTPSLSHRVQLNQYGGGTYTGTAAKWLAVDSSGYIIEENAPTGSSVWTVNTNDIYWDPPTSGRVWFGDNATSTTTRMGLVVSEAVGNKGRIIFTTSSGSNVNNLTTIADIKGTITQADIGGSETLKGQLEFYTNSGDSINQVMTLDDAGNLGLGTATPGIDIVGTFDYTSSPLLQVDGTNARLIARGSNSGALDLIDTGAGVGDKWMQLINDSGITKFRSINDSGAVVVDPILIMDHDTGNVGIGVTPAEKLHVKSTVNDASAEVIGLSPLANDTVQGGLGVNTGGIVGLIGVNQLNFYTASTERMTIDSSGNVGIGATPSTYGRVYIKDSTVTSTNTTTHLFLHANPQSAYGAGTGSNIDFGISKFGNTAYAIARISGIETGSEAWDGGLVFSTSTSVGALTEKMRINHNGAIQFNSYGVGTFDNTPTRYLAVDGSGNVIESTGTASLWSESGGNVYRLTGAVTIGSSTIFRKSFNIVGTSPVIDIYESDQGADGKSWQIGTAGGTIHYSVRNDADSAGNDYLYVTRTGTTINNVVFPNGNVGIGVASDTRLHVYSGSTGLQMRIGDNVANRSPILRFTGANATPTNRHFDIELDSINFEAVIYAPSAVAPSTKAIQINDTGQVGIGVSPSALFHLYAADPRIYIQDSVDGVVGSIGNANNFITSATARELGIRAETNLVFATGGGTERMQIDSSGKVGIGVSPSYKFDILPSATGDGLVIGGDVNLGTRTNATRKYGRIMGAHYTNAEEPIGLITYDSTSTQNILAFGGLTSYANAATEISFWTAANSTTTSGTQRMTINSSGSVKINTGLWSSSNPDLNMLVYNGVENGEVHAHGVGTGVFTHWAYNGTTMYRVYDIDNAGQYFNFFQKVGIGLTAGTTPSYPFHLVGAENQRARFAFGTDTIDLVNYGTGAEDYSNSSGLFTNDNTLIMTGAVDTGEIRFITRNTANGYKTRYLITSANNSFYWKNVASANMMLLNTSSGYPYLRLYSNDGTTEKAVIDTNGNSHFSGGNVGIGQIPKSLLTLYDSSNGYLNFIPSSTIPAYSATYGEGVGIYWNDGASRRIGFYTHNDSALRGWVDLYEGNDGGANYFSVGTNTAERMRIDSSGYVTLSTTPQTGDTGDYYLVRDATGVVKQVATTASGTGYVYVSSIDPTAGVAYPFMGLAYSDGYHGIYQVPTLYVDTTAHQVRLGERNTALTNTTYRPLRITHQTSGTATTNFGVGIEFQTEQSSGIKVGGYFDCTLTENTFLAEDFNFEWWLKVNGTLTQRMMLESSGKLTIYAGGMDVQSGDSYFQGAIFNNAIRPETSSNGTSGYDVGVSGYRWRTGYIYNGVTTGSDIREKNWGYLPNWGLEAVMGVQPIYWAWKSDPDQTRIRTGFSAEEIHQKLLAKGINNWQGVTLDETGFATGLNHDQIIPILWKGVQELKDEKDLEIEALQDEIQLLKDRITVLETQ